MITKEVLQGPEVQIKLLHGFDWIRVKMEIS